MATKLSMDPRRLEHAFASSGRRTVKAAVTRVLEAFIARRACAGPVSASSV